MHKATGLFLLPYRHITEHQRATQ